MVEIGDSIRGKDIYIIQTGTKYLRKKIAEFLKITLGQVKKEMKNERVTEIRSTFFPLIFRLLL